MRKPVLAVAMLLSLLAACRAEEPESVENRFRRQEQQVQDQARQYERDAENFTVAYERSLENQQAVIFDNRGNLLNESGANAAAPQP